MRSSSRHLRYLLATLVIVCLAGSAGCGDSPAGPDPPDRPATSPLLGTWSGTIADNAMGTSAMTLAIHDVNIAVAGTWTLTRPAGAGTVEGTMSGVLNGGVLTFFLTPQAGLVCSPTVTLSGTMAGSMVVAQGRLQGSYSRFVCDALGVVGTLDLTKQ